MTRARVQDDLDRIVVAARELVDRAVSYERCLDDYFTALAAAHRGDTSHLWSFDNVHLDHLPRPTTTEDRASASSP